MLPVRLSAEPVPTLPTVMVTPASVAAVRLVATFHCALASAKSATASTPTPAALLATALGPPTLTDAEALTSLAINTRSVLSATLPRDSAPISLPVTLSVELLTLPARRLTASGARSPAVAVMTPSVFCWLLPTATDRPGAFVPWSKTLVMAELAVLVAWRTLRLRVASMPVTASGAGVPA